MRDENEQLQAEKDLFLNLVSSDPAESLIEEAITTPSVRPGRCVADLDLFIERVAPTPDILAQVTRLLDNQAARPQPNSDLVLTFVPVAHNFGRSDVRTGKVLGDKLAEELGMDRSQMMVNETEIPGTGLSGATGDNTTSFGDIREAARSFQDNGFLTLSPGAAEASMLDDFVRNLMPFDFALIPVLSPIQSPEETQFTAVLEPEGHSDDGTFFMCAGPPGFHDVARVNAADLAFSQNLLEFVKDCDQKTALTHLEGLDFVAYNIETNQTSDPENAATQPNTILLVIDKNEKAVIAAPDVFVEDAEEQLESMIGLMSGSCPDSSGLGSEPPELIAPGSNTIQ